MADADRSSMPPSPGRSRNGSDPELRIPTSTLRVVILAIVTAVGGGAFGGMVGVASKEEVAIARQQAAEAQETAREATRLVNELRIVVTRLDESALSIKEALADLRAGVNVCRQEIRAAGASARVRRNREP